MILSKPLVGSLILSGVLAVAIAFLFLQLSRKEEVISHLEGWQDGMVQAVRLASGNDKVVALTAVAQVQSLGESVAMLHATLKTSNDTVDRLAADKVRAEAIAAREGKARAAAIRTAEQLRAQLLDRALVAVPADEMETEVRRAQDAAYHAGL